jgi:hypothetical protein
VTGGLAVGQIETNLFSSPGSPGGPTGIGAQFGIPGGFASDRQINAGWTLGGGVEMAVSRLLGWGPGWSAKIEYLYVDLGTIHINTPQVSLPATAGAGPFVTGATTFNSSTQEHMLRVGLNYRLGARPEPDRSYSAMYTSPAHNWTGIPRLGSPGQCHDFYSCECGYVTSREHADSHALQMAEREVGKIRLRLDKEFLKWARFANKVTAPPVPPKLVE